MRDSTTRATRSPCWRDEWESDPGDRYGPRRVPSTVTDRGAHERRGFAPGQEDGPAALRAAGLADALRAVGRELRDRGDTQKFRWSVDHEEPRTMNADAVVEGVVAVAARVEAAVREGELALVLGGDCTVGIGTVAGAVAAGRDPRLIYLDLHADLNTPSSVPDGALDWTGVAHMLDVPGADPRLADAGPRRPLLPGADLLILGRGPGQSTPAEHDLIVSRALTTIDVDELRDDPCGAARRAREWATADDRPFLVPLRSRPRRLLRRAALRAHRARNRRAVRRGNGCARDPRRRRRAPRGNRHRAQPAPRCGGRL
ncbi:MAG: arginase family protein [Solirubrobacterales bacterium]|nr:arginase family protein [Solirubrobacterales bacterium]